MCLIVLAWRVHPDYPLVVAANRDEFHARPAAAAAFWSDQPRILAGRDLEAGGTWMGVSRAGPNSIRFAAVTNYRGATEPRAAESRGALVARFLTNDASPSDYAQSVHTQGSAYSGFNILATDGDETWWLSNRDSGPRRLDPGIYGLGNLLLDSPETDAAKQRLAAAIDPAPSVEPLFGVLASAKIVGQQYGTRCSTVMVRGAEGRIRYAERGFGPDGEAGETRHFELG